jgi:hypothetical protein
LVVSLDFSTDGQGRRKSAVSDTELDGVFGGDGGHCTNGKACQWDGTSGCAGPINACSAVWVDHWLGGYWEARGFYVDAGCEVDNEECVDGDPNDQCTIVSGGCPGSTYSYDCELDWDYNPPHAVKNPDTKTETQCQDVGLYHSDGCDLGHG